MTLSKAAIKRNREKGHLLRRITHLVIALIPLIYYHYFPVIAAFFSLTPEKILSIVVVMVILLESLRLWKKWRFYGQRSHEISYISSAAWTIVTASLVLLQCPNEGIATALILALAFADPAMGEARLFNAPNYLVAAIGLLIVFLVWVICSIFFAIPWWLTLIMPPITVAAEWLDLASIDDNATMLLIPLTVILFLTPWF